MAKIESEEPNSSSGFTRKPTEIQKFIISPATKDTCVYAGVDAFYDQTVLTYQRLERLADDSSLKVDPSQIFVVTSSDLQKTQLLRLLKNHIPKKSKTLNLADIEVESVTNLVLVDTKKLFNSVKYLFCVNMTNFKANNIYNLLKFSEGRHLTITDNINKTSENLENARRYLKTRFGSLMKPFSFSSGKTASSSSSSRRSSRKKIAYTPSIELIRTLVNKDTLCSKVNRGLLSIQTEAQLIQLIHKFLTNPKDNVTFLMTMCFFNFPNGKPIERKHMTSLCNIIERENIINGKISVYDFFVEFDSSLNYVKHLYQPMIVAYKMLKTNNYKSVMSTFKFLLLKMKRKKLFDNFKIVAEKNKKKVNTTDQLNWIDQLVGNPDINLLGSKIENLKFAKTLDVEVESLTERFSQVNVDVSVSNAYLTHNKPIRLTKVPVPRVMHLNTKMGLKLVKRL